jgi:hypothetical protein
MARGPFAGAGGIARGVDELAGRTGRRGVVMLFSDLLDDVPDILAGLQHIRYHKHEVVLFHTLDAAEIAESVRSGKGSLGKFVNDDELYTRVTGIATQAEDIATSVRQVVENAKNTLEGFQSKDGPVQGMTVSVTAYRSNARAGEFRAESITVAKRTFDLR